MFDVATLLLVFIFVFFLDRMLIKKVPSLLHTPLMSMTNAISGLTLLGAVLLFAAKTTVTVKVLGAAAIVMAAFNLLGGLVVTDRMLRMFKKKRNMTDSS